MKKRKQMKEKRKKRTNEEKERNKHSHTHPSTKAHQTRWATSVFLMPNRGGEVLCGSRCSCPSFGVGVFGAHTRKDALTRTHAATTTGPTDATAPDFWRMIWQTNAPIIAMVCVSVCLCVCVCVCGFVGSLLACAHAGLI